LVAKGFGQQAAIAVVQPGLVAPEMKLFHLKHLLPTLQPEEVPLKVWQD
jgi:hypothetical protein